MKNVLITGADGFIGYHLVKKMLKKKEILKYKMILQRMKMIVINE